MRTAPPSMLARDPAVDYTKVRGLWKYHSRKMSDWERKFVTNLGTMLSKKQIPTVRQWNTLDRIMLKYFKSPDQIIEASVKKKRKQK